MQLAINIIDVINHEGVTLRKTGKVHKACCPFHQDKTPSFTVYEDSNRFICFGCGERGDAIDFIMKLRNLTFKEALAYLRIDSKYKPPRKDPRTNNRQKQLAEFRKWEKDLYNELATENRAINRVFIIIQTIEEAERYALLYHRLPIIEYRLEVLAYGGDEEKFTLFQGIEK